MRNILRRQSAIYLRTRQRAAAHRGSPQNHGEYFLDTIDSPRMRAATAEEIEDRLGPVSAAVVVCGHSHAPRIARSRQGQLLLNPGSVGLQAYENEGPVYHVVENNSPHACNAIMHPSLSGGE